MHPALLPLLSASHMALHSARLQRLSELVPARRPVSAPVSPFKAITPPNPFESELGQGGPGGGPPAAVAQPLDSPVTPTPKL